MLNHTTNKEKGRYTTSREENKNTRPQYSHSGDCLWGSLWHESIVLIYKEVTPIYISTWGFPNSWGFNLWIHMHYRHSIIHRKSGSAMKSDKRGLTSINYCALEPALFSVIILSCQKMYTLFHVRGRNSEWKKNKIYAQHSIWGKHQVPLLLTKTYFIQNEVGWERKT